MAPQGKLRPFTESVLLLRPPPPAPPPTCPQLVSEFQAFKHMECLAPGVLQRAADPLEVQLSIQPTMVLQNALPYEMRVLIWQVRSARCARVPCCALHGLCGGLCCVPCCNHMVQRAGREWELLCCGGLDAGT